MLTPTRTWSSSAVWLAVLLTAGLIVLRSFVFLQYEQADFDADQAIVGLMGLHLAEGRAWPLFFYGQLYMLGVQAWMAALAFLVTGPTVFGLKLPLLVLNVVTGGVLIWRLVRDARLPAWQALVSTLWFAALPPITASRLVQAQGGTIEPLLYTLVLWMLRQRAVAFGLVFAIGFLHREFTLFAVLALLAIELWTGTLLNRTRLAHWVVVLLVFTGAREGVTVLRHWSSMFGPEAPPPRLEDAVTNVDLVARSVCLAPTHVVGNLAWLVGQNVPTFFGLHRQPAGALIATARPTGVVWAWLPAVVALGLSGVVVWRFWRWLPPGREPPDTRVVLPTLLVVSGLLSLGGVATGCDVRSLITIRYHLLLVWFPVGLTALTFLLAPRARHPRAVVAGLAAGVVIWAVAMTASHVALVREYATAPPPNPFRVLADDLAQRGQRDGWATYWVSYHVDFLSQERVQLSPTSAIRIAAYARQAFEAGPSAVTIGTEPCGVGEPARRVAVWWVCGGR